MQFAANIFTKLLRKSRCKFFHEPDTIRRIFKNFFNIFRSVDFVWKNGKEINDEIRNSEFRFVIWGLRNRRLPRNPRQLPIMKKVKREGWNCNNFFPASSKRMRIFLILWKWKISRLFFLSFLFFFPSTIPHAITILGWKLQYQRMYETTLWIIRTKSLSRGEVGGALSTRASSKLEVSSFSPRARSN